MKNRIIILITALSLMIILVGCKQDENTSLSKDKLQITGKVNENTDEKDGVIFTREDEDRLVKINIKDGSAKNHSRLPSSIINTTVGIVNSYWL